MPNAVRFETLENRRLMTATISPGTQQAMTDVGPGYTGEKTGTIGLAKLTLDTDGTLTVYGTSSGERFHPVISKNTLSFEVTRYFATGAYPKLGTVIYDALPAEGTILYDSAGDTVVMPITPQSDLYRVSLADVKKVVVFAGDGADVVDLSNLDIPAEVHGGAGGDTITGGLRDDSLYGEAGEDQISDNKGNDLLDGGRGSDRLIAKKGANTLKGGAGGDQLFSYSPENLIDGGSEDDTAVLQAAPDEIDSIETFDPNRSTLMPTAESTTALAGRVTLRRDGDSLDLDAIITVSSGGWAIDWDLVKNSRGEVSVNATTYAPLGGATQALTPHTTSFELDQPLSQRSVKVSLTVNGNAFASGKTLVSKSFGSRDYVGGEAAYAYELVPANESLRAADELL
ncbi:MAG: calcium-binding protein [Tepidisphaeraceae bacterium]